MPLNIVVCVKSTPNTVNVGLDAGGKLKLAGIQQALNPYDEFAIEEGVRLKEKNPGSTVTALSVGPAASEGALRDAIARGCDGGVLVTGPEFESGGGFAASYALSLALKKLHAAKPVHVVLFGKNTNDGGRGVVGGETAAWLGWPGLLSIKKIDSIDEKSAVVWRMMEDGVDVLKVALPACLSTVKEINEPRLPSLKGKMASKKAAIPQWKAAELGFKAEEAGDLSPVGTTSFSHPPPRPGGLKIEGATPEEKAKKLVDALVERKLL
ncbi:MAG: electron transfer flavoprotein subunit beta/FixA family protein [Elusimicrobia bacterium]|nr:electron transfer flavoprotein subunit beta/FixA family protein [Elusimicrobiota bacterium]